MAKERDKGISFPFEPSKDDAATILHMADTAIEMRGQKYNDSNTKEGRERHMFAIVGAFNALTGQSLTIREGWIFMVVLKIARAIHTDDLDTYIDMAAYAALAGEQRNA